MSEFFGAATAFVAGYLIGSVEFAVLVARRMDVDIYAAGSGNPGTSNVLRVLGKKVAAVVLLGDAAKGLAAAAIGDAIGGPVVALAATFAATLGHAFPVWHRFRGGRGVATAIGGIIWVEPVWGILLAAGWLAVVLVTKTASVASLTAMTLLVPALAVAGQRNWALAWGAAAAGLVIWRHKDNIVRIVRRSENRLPV